MSIQLSAPQIKEYLLWRARLNQKLPSISAYFAKFKVVQVDPLNVVARSHELVLRNRVEDFSLAKLEADTYGEARQSFEYWLQLYSLIDINAYPYLAAKRNSGKSKDSWQFKFAAEHKKEIKLALEYLQSADRPISGKDLQHLPAASNFLSWNKTNSRKALLEYLWDSGTLMVSHREGNNKFYDLTDRILPAEILQQEVSQMESLEFVLKSYFDYLGIVSRKMLFRSGRTLAQPLRKLLDEYLDSGKVLQLDLQIKGKQYVWATEWQEFNERDLTAAHVGLQLIAPLDPLIIDRDILESVFGFYYRWEVYTPPAKRKVGYYNMPILYNGEFIGQIALRKDKQKVLQVENIVFENQKWKDSAEVTKLLQSEIESLQQLIS